MGEEYAIENTVGGAVCCTDWGGGGNMPYRAVTTVWGRICQREVWGCAIEDTVGEGCAGGGVCHREHCRERYVMEYTEGESTP